MGKKTIAVDLDGVIFKYDGWKGIDHFGEPVEEVREALNALRGMGFEIVIYTTRVNHLVNEGYWQYDLVKKVKEALEIAGIPFDRIEIMAKPIAKYYIDDRAIRFENWTQAVNDVMAMETIDDPVKD